MNENLFESKILEYFNGVVGSIDKYSNKHKIQEFKISLEPNESTILGIQGAVQKKETLTKDLIIQVKLNTKEDWDTYKVQIPVPLEGVFVVRGNVRLNLNYLTSNNVVKITKNILHVDNDINILVAPRYEGDTRLGLMHLEFDESNRRVWVPIDEVDLTDRNELIPKKLKVLFDLDEYPTKIDQALVDHIIANYDLSLRDNIVNKEFLTTVGMFLTHLRDYRFEMLRILQSKFYRFGNIAAYSVQAIINKFFNLQSIASVGIQTPNNINPATYNSLRDKIILSKGGDKGVSFSSMDPSYTDFVDMVITPDNKNVNRINELTSAINISDEGAFVTCYDRNFQKVEVPFIDYVTSRILVHDEVDYDKKTYPSKMEYTVKISGKRTTVKDGKFDYIELPSDERLSKSVKMIPMMNHSDSVRGSMGARMIGQSIEVVGCEKPIVASGHEKIDSALSVTSPVDGIVTAVDKGIVIVKSMELDENGDNINYTITKPSNLESMYGINISFNTRVKVGQSVVKGDLVFSPNSIANDNSFNYGVNLLVAMMNYRGFTYEDGVVVSESAARKFAHISVQDVELVVSPDTVINGIRVPSTDKLDSSTTLCDYEIKLDRISKNLNKARLELLGDHYMKPCTLKVPMNVKEAYLVDVKFIVGDQPSNVDETIHQIEGIIGSHRNPVDPPVNYDYNKLTLDDFDGDVPCSYRIKFRLVLVNHLTKGDKLTNRYGSKGVVSLIEKDEHMPRLEDGTPVDAIMNPAAVVSRKNISQTMEMYLAVFSAYVKDRCKMMLSEGHTHDEVRKFLDKYHYTNYSSLSDEALDNLLYSDSVFQIVTGVFSKITIEDIISWFKEENLEIGSKLIDGRTGSKIRKPVVVGGMYLMKLYHLASKKAQVTVDHSVKAKLVLGQGKESASGLKTGNMEMDALIANNLTKYVKYIDGNDTLKSAWFLAHCTLAGLGLGSGE